MYALIYGRLDYCNFISFNSFKRHLLRYVPALMDLDLLLYPQHITNKHFICLNASLIWPLNDFCISTSLVPDRSALRSAAGDIVVLNHQNDWGMTSL